MEKNYFLTSSSGKDLMPYESKYTSTSAILGPDKDGIPRGKGKDKAPYPGEDHPMYMPMKEGQVKHRCKNQGQRQCGRVIDVAAFFEKAAPLPLSMIVRRKRGDSAPFQYAASLTTAPHIANTKWRCKECDVQLVGNGNAGTLLTHAYLVHGQTVLDKQPKTWDDLKELFYTSTAKLGPLEGDSGSRKRQKISENNVDDFLLNNLEDPTLQDPNDPEEFGLPFLQDHNDPEDPNDPNYICTGKMPTDEEMMEWLVNQPPTRDAGVKAYDAIQKQRDANLTDDPYVSQIDPY